VESAESEEAFCEGGWAFGEEAGGEGSGWSDSRKARSSALAMSSRVGVGRASAISGVEGGGSERGGWDRCEAFSAAWGLGEELDSHPIAGSSVNTRNIKCRGSAKRVEQGSDVTGAREFQGIC